MESLRRADLALLGEQALSNQGLARRFERAADKVAPGGLPGVRPMSETGRSGFPSYYSVPARRNSGYGDKEHVTQPARPHRRPRPERRNNIRYVEASRNIGYTRDDTPLSPVLTDRNYSPLQTAPPEVFYPSELARQRDLEKDRAPDEYMDIRRREQKVLRQGKELDVRDHQKADFGEKQYYHNDRGYRGNREYRDGLNYRAPATPMSGPYRAEITHFQPQRKLKETHVLPQKKGQARGRRLHNKMYLFICGGRW